MGTVRGIHMVVRLTPPCSESLTSPSREGVLLCRTSRFGVTWAAPGLCLALGVLGLEVTWLVAPGAHVIVAAERAATVAPVEMAAYIVGRTSGGRVARLATRVARPRSRVGTLCDVRLKNSKSTVLSRVVSYQA